MTTYLAFAILWTCVSECLAVAAEGDAFGSAPKDQRVLLNDEIAFWAHYPYSNLSDCSTCVATSVALPFVRLQYHADRLAVPLPYPVNERCCFSVAVVTRVAAICDDF